MATYYQPDSDRAVLLGNQFFRLNTELSNPGAIWESKQSGYNFALGPLSDIAHVRIGYFDESVPTFLNQFAIGPGRPWNGQVIARNDALYAPANRPGRILIWSDDIYVEDYIPVGHGVGDQLISVVPRIDVIETFSPSDQQPGRIDRQFFWPYLPFPVNDLFLIIPYYGRKTASVRIANQTTGDVTYSIRGLNYNVDAQTSGPGAGGIETPIVTNVVIPTVTVATKIVKEGTDGMFDALILVVHADGAGGGPIPIFISTSDVPVG